METLACEKRKFHVSLPCVCPALASPRAHWPRPFVEVACEGTGHLVQSTAVAVECNVERFEREFGTERVVLPVDGLERRGRRPLHGVGSNEF